MKLEMSIALDLIEKFLKEYGGKFEGENRVNWALLRPTGREIYLVTNKILKDEVP